MYNYAMKKAICIFPLLLAGAVLAAEPVRLDTGTGILFGTLETPGAKPPYPVVLIIAGSGPTDRDGNSPLLVIEVMNHVLRKFPRQGTSSSRRMAIRDSFLRLTGGQARRPVLQLHLLPDTLNADPFRLFPGRAVEAFDRLMPRFAAEREGLVMHGQEDFRARVIAHLPGLFRRAVIQ